MRFRVQGLGQSLGFRVLGFRVYGSFIGFIRALQGLFGFCLRGILGVTRGLSGVDGFSKALTCFA